MVNMTKYKFCRKENYVNIISITKCSTSKRNEGDPVTQITEYDFGLV